MSGGRRGINGDGRGGEEEAGAGGDLGGTVKG